MSNLFRYFVIALISVTTFSSVSSQSLDLTFDTDGWALSGLTLPTSYFVWNSGIQSDNKVISYITQSGLGTEVRRFNEDGTVDNTFSNISISAPNSTARAILVDASDKFYIAYRNGLPGSEIKRYNSDGTIDGTFTSLSVSFTVYRLELDNTGKILAVGTDDTDAMIARINGTGTLDATFGSGGTVNLGAGWGRDVTEDASGNLIVLYNDYPNTKITKLTATGTTDASFGTAGVGTYNNTSAFTCLDIHSVAGGYIGVGYYYDSVVNTFGTFKIDNNGTLDATYGIGGYGDTGIAGFTSPNTQTSVKCGLSDNIALMYRGGSLANTEFGIAMIDPTDGSLNTTFGTGGTMPFSFTSPINTQSLSIDNLGRLVVNSSTEISGTNDILVTRIDIPPTFNAPITSIAAFGSIYFQSFIQLQPLSVAPGCVTTNDQGKVYFDKNQQKLNVCTSSGWEPLH